MSVKTKIAGVVMALMALSAPIVWADNDGGGKDSWHQDGGKHHGMMEDMMVKILNLSGTQVKQLKDIHQKQKETMKSTFEQIKANREAFNEEMVKAAPDMNKINDLQTQLKSIQSQMVDEHLNSVLAIKKVLTTEQYAGYAALEKERKMMKHMMGHGKFDHKDGWGKDGDGHKHWGDKSDSGDQD